MSDLLYYLLVAIVFVVMISILVAAHEFGHYLFARMFNMGVEEFAIGFGKNPLVTYARRRYTVPLAPGQNPFEDADGAAPDLGWTSLPNALEGGSRRNPGKVIDTPRGKALEEETDFTIRPWPLGGFVRIKGMMPEEDGREVRVPGGFYSKPPWQRFLVLLAGPLFSVVAGVLVLIPVYMFDGFEKPNQAPVLGYVQDGPAAKAGLKARDRIVSIDGKPMTSFYQVVQVVRSNGGHPLKFVYERNGKQATTTVTPALGTKPTPVFGPDMMPTDRMEIQGKIQVAPDVENVRLGFGEAFMEAIDTPWQAVDGILGIFRHPSTFEDSVGGPVTMVEATSVTVKLGFAKVAWLAAMLSISVGVFNLLPTVPLDGGQMVIAVAEMFRRGRRLSMPVQNAFGAVGLCLVCALIAGVMFVDVKRWVGPKEPVPAAQSSGAKK